MDDVYASISTHRSFIERFDSWLKKLLADGVEKTLVDYVYETSPLLNRNW
jgi:hypothetical protein